MYTRSIIKTAWGLGCLTLGAMLAAETAVIPSRMTKLWSANLGTSSYGALALGPQTVAARGVNGRLAVFNLQGEPLWQTTLGGNSLPSPVICADSLVCLDADGQLRSYEAETGRQRWQVPVGASETPLLVWNDRIAVVAGDTLAIYRGVDGQRLWQASVAPLTSRDEWTFGTGAPVLSGDSLYWVDGDRMIRSWLHENGHLQWANRLPETKGRDMIGLWTPLVTDAGILVITRRNQAVLADRNDGSHIKTLKFTSDIGTLLDATGQVAFVPRREARNHIAAIDLSNGQELWQSTVDPNRSWMNTVRTDGPCLWVGGSDSHALYLLEQATGRVVLSEAVASRFWSAPVRWGDSLFTLTEDGEIRRYRLD